MRRNDEALLEHVENMSTQEVLQDIAVVKVLMDRLKQYDKVLREDFKEHHADVDESIATINGTAVGRVSVTKDGLDTFVVKDKTLYGAFLKEVGEQIAGGLDAWEDRPVARPEACTNNYLRTVVENNGGELPDGVDIRPGRPATVVYKQTIKDDFPLTMDNIRDVIMKEIEA